VIHSVVWLHILLGPYWGVYGSLFGMRSCFNGNFNILLKQLFCASIGKQNVVLPETFLILRRTERDMIKNGLHVKYPLFLSDFYENGIFFTDFSKNI
jgi:hypothetical protein